MSEITKKRGVFHGLFSSMNFRKIVSNSAKSIFKVTYYVNFNSPSKSPVALRVNPNKISELAGKPTWVLCFKLFGYYIPVQR